MPSPEPKSPTIKVAEEFFFPDKPGGQLTLSVLSTHEGADADYMRSKLASRSVSELSDAYLQYYSKRYPGIESAAKLEIFDNRDGDIINIRESYRLPTPTTVDRAGPVSLGSPVYRRHSVTVRNLKARFSGGRMKSVVTPYLSLTSSWSNTPTTFEVQWDFRTLATQVPAKAISDYLNSVKDVGDNLDWTYDFTYQDVPADPLGSDPDRSQQQVITGVLLVSIFIGVPLLMAFRRR
ncbi:MAG: hypothetical protein E5X00_20135 [Mesorhizobium sp.]|nr:MAG: hypothetical protein E5X00_20135 [Mesorhizobium sp.]